MGVKGKTALDSITSVKFLSVVIDVVKMIETRVLMTLMSHSFPHPSVDPNLHDDDDDDDDGDDDDDDGNVE